jgi:hypothetical protein
VSTTVRQMNCSPEDVFAVLEDGWVWPTWVVGVSRMREVDDAWPRVGSKIQHSVGVWPVLINDEATVLEYDPPRRLVTQPAGWPIGEARVRIDVKPRGTGCVVRITETAEKGPGSWRPQPLLDIPLAWRNTEVLRRLAYIAEGKKRQSRS